MNRPFRLARLAGSVAVVLLAACSAHPASDSDVGRQVAEHLCPIQAGCDCD